MIPSNEMMTAVQLVNQLEEVGNFDTNSHSVLSLQATDSIKHITDEMYFVKLGLIFHFMAWGFS
jgi:hypothetical protein